MKKKELIFMTGNPHKLLEAQNILGEGFNLISSKSLGFIDDVVEDADSFKGNAKLKVEAFLSFYGKEAAVIAEDSGLCVNHLNGAPGIYTARYAGADGNNIKNMDLLLSNLSGVKDRNAYFITSISLFQNNEFYSFEGRIYGRISESAIGDLGFGYDPIFLPKGQDKTMAELGADFKKKYSHRAHAFRDLLKYTQGI